MKKIIVVGYPKSGNTWITRLVGELAQCPVKGFLYSDNFEIAAEGKDRISEYECYKSHHQYSDLIKDDLLNAKIIYVLRDPRDISLSGIPYFFEWQTIVNKWSKSLPVRVINKLYRMTFFADIRAKQLMNNAIINGDKRVHAWCKVSWKEHLMPYLLNDKILKIKYEDMLSNAFEECKRIVNFIGEDRSDEKINAAIEFQSFDKAKKRYIESNLYNSIKHLRTGQKEQWRNKITKRESELFKNKLGDILKQLNYPVV